MSLPPNDSMLVADPSDPEEPDKIEKEASHVNAFAYANERYLVALVLLTRLQDDDLYVTVWDSILSSSAL
jgi:hypothetical protein